MIERRPHPADEAPDAEGEVLCHLDAVLVARGMTLAELSRRVGVTQVNLSVLKNNRAKAIRFSTLVALCLELRVQPGELFTVEPDPDPEPTHR